jgi:importin-4
VTDINRSLCTILKSCGPAILVSGSSTVVQEMTTTLLSIITKKHQCQQDLGDDDADDDLAESAEYDWLVVDTAIDCVGALSAALGQSFAELWKIFEKPIHRYASSQDATERTTAVGVIAECIHNMGPAVTPFTGRLMKIIVHRLGDENGDVKGNAVYAAGVLCEASTDDYEILANYGSILSKLQPLLDGATPSRLLDNSAGCVARLITKHPDRVPLDEVLPAFVNLLPAKEDFEENQPTMRCIINLCESSRRRQPRRKLIC